MKVSSQSEYIFCGQPHRLKTSEEHPIRHQWKDPRKFQVNYPGCNTNEEAYIGLDERPYTKPLSLNGYVPLNPLPHLQTETKGLNGQEVNPPSKETMGGPMGYTQCSN